MGTPKVAAVLTANAALSSILTMMLRECPDLRVRQFGTAGALLAYARIAPIDALVCDFTLPGVSLTALVRNLRRGTHSQARQVKVIALTRHIDRAVQSVVAEAGIDEVVIKPMSPAYIKERVLARLGIKLAPAAESSGFVAVLRPRPRVAPAPTEGVRPSAEIVDLLSRRGPRPPVTPRP